MLRDDLLERYQALMRSAGLPEAATSSFCFHLRRLSDGITGLLDALEISPVEDVPDLAALETAVDLEVLGESALARVVVIKLNGGLGTSMGLQRAKSLLEVREGLSFLDLIARQILSLRQRHESTIPLLLMNSFRTAHDSEYALARYSALREQPFPLGFLQHKVPKILADDLAPAPGSADDESGWCPPGHGDVYAALSSSGLLDELLAAGIEYAFVSNADNLGAVLDPCILGHMVASGADFLMEVADRTAADRKGGHLCRLRDGRLALRELAQCPVAELSHFQDIETFRYFNTNNVWVSLSALRELLQRHDGVLPLATIVNRKRLDPRDPRSPSVIQLETAMGAALSEFDKATAVRVGRHRFSPVKTTADLLAVRSDAYVLTDDGRVTLHPSRTSPPTIDLFESYKIIDEFEARFGRGVPSLIDCDGLRITGDVSFGRGVRVHGRAILHAAEATTVADGTVLEGELHLS